MTASGTTTVKVQTTTGDLLRSVSAERHETADQVIRAALTALRRNELRQVAAQESRSIAVEPEDLAEVRAIQDDIAALHAG